MLGGVRRGAGRCMEPSFSFSWEGLPGLLQLLTSVCACTFCLCGRLCNFNSYTKDALEHTHTHILHLLHAHIG
jgi:hypothetical protein